MDPYKLEGMEQNQMYLTGWLQKSMSKKEEGCPDQRMEISKNNAEDVL